VDHRGKLELAGLLLGDAEAHEPAAVARHEVDRLGGDELRGEGQVPLVLAVLVVDEDDHLPGLEILDSLFDPGKRHPFLAFPTNSRAVSGSPA
jgi:hypothetical protein